MRIPVSAASYLLLPLLIAASIQTPGYSQAKQLDKDKAARMVLDSARRAYSSGQFDTAAQRFAEFLSKYSTHTEAPSASYGLGLSQLKRRTHASITAAVTAFRKASGPMDYANRPLAIYYLGVSLRDLASSTLTQKLTSGSDYRASNAKQYREEAARHFAGAADAFIARSKKAAPTSAPAVHPDIIWATRAKSDQCDMLLRVGQYKQAIALAKTLLNDKQFAPRAIYNMGYAHFAMKDYQSAGKTLSKLAPFKQTFGPHGRYLLARSHHLSGQMPEAAVLYKAIVDDYAARKAAATTASRSSYRSLPVDQRAAAAAMVAGPPPPYIVRTIFYSALGLAESGRFANALGGFTTFATQYPKHALAPEAQLRQGYCQLQLRSYAEAIKTLDPLRKHPKLADRARWWIARARVGSANPEVPAQYAQILAAATGELTAAAASAHNSGRSNPKAYVQERDILIELGDVQILAGKYKEAAATYYKITSTSDRYEEALQRLATAYHLGGDYARSDSTCNSFMQKFPKSTLLPAIWFRSAENACMAAINTKRSGYGGGTAEIELRFKDAVNRYQRLLDKFPDFSQAHLARYGLATAQYRLGWYTEALETVAAIPSADRTGKLAAIPYLIADCHIRTFPTTTDNALTAGKLMTQATEAAKLLEGFASSNAKSPKAPDALLKLGFCYQRLGAVVADATARKTAYTQGKNAYARLIKGYSKDPLAPTAMIEQAKCMVLLGDSKTALNELDRFQRDPFRANPVAPLAITQFSSLLRASKRAVDAVRIVKECRERHEKDMARDPVRIAWIPALQYEHALATMDTGKLAEARAMFESLTKKYPGSPEAVNSLWRAGQCQRKELVAAIAAAEKTPSADGEAAVNKAVRSGFSGLATVATQLTAQAATIAKTDKGSEAQLRLLYESAWCYRILSEKEIESARQKLQKDAMYQERSFRSSKGGGKSPTTLTPPRVSLEDLPVQESEAKAIKLYQELIALATQAPLAARSRFELAEMFAHRRKHDPAAELMETILENNPPQDLAQLTRLRLAACLLDRGDPKRAMALVKLVAAKAKGEQIGHVKYLTGEAYILQKEWSKAIEELKVFRDTANFRAMTGIADRALLRLALAYERTGNWGECQRAFASIPSYIPKSPWIHEARFGDAWARENSKDYSNAMSYYAALTTKTATEVGAKAQLRLGYCQMIQKKYPEAASAFMVIPQTYNYPDISVEAWYQSGVAYAAMKKPADAEKSWKQLVKDYPKSKWAEQAKKQLELLAKTAVKKTS
jgi:cellulose synthase operon protein C